MEDGMEDTVLFQNVVNRVPVFAGRLHVYILTALRQ